MSLLISLMLGCMTASGTHMIAFAGAEVLGSDRSRAMAPDPGADRAGAGEAHQHGVLPHRLGAPCHSLSGSSAHSTPSVQYSTVQHSAVQCIGVAVLLCYRPYAACRSSCCWGVWQVVLGDNSKEAILKVCSTQRPQVQQTDCRRVCTEHVQPFTGIPVADVACVRQC